MIVVSLLLVFSVNVQASRCPKFTDTGFCWPIGKSDQEFDQACGKWLGRDAVHGGCYFNGLYHIGVDMMTNGNFYAISNGKVFYKHCDDSSWGSGNCALFIRHQASDGTVFTGLYGHVRTSLNVGDEVQLGQVIGTAGPYGNGEHLHFGIRLGDSVMPSPWGRLSNSRWPDTNGFVDPIAFIKNHKPKNPTSFRFTPQKVINRCKAKLEGNLAKHGLQLKEWQNLRVITHKKVFDPQTQGNLYDFIVSGQVSQYSVVHSVEKKGFWQPTMKIRRYLLIQKYKITKLSKQTRKIL